MKIDKSFWNEKKVFVTGGEGFIGSYLVKMLVDVGADVFIIERDQNKNQNTKLHGVAEKLTRIKGDIADYDVVQRALHEHEIEVVFHIAAQALVQTANASPLSTFESNIKGTWVLMEACRNTPSVKRIVVASSDKAYGIQENLPYTEDQPLNGLYPYDASKVCTDVLARSYAKSFDMNIAITRNANTYGPGDQNFSRIIPGGCRAILKGTDLEIRSDGRPERDYVYVEDVAEGYLILAQEVHRDEVKGQAFNFGSGIPTSVLEVFNTLIKVAGKNIEPKVLKSATNEIDRQFLSIEKVKKVFDWQPKYGLEEGLKLTYDWYEKHIDEL